METHGSFTAFAGTKLVARGPLERLLVAVKEHVDASMSSSAQEPAVLIFEDRTGMQCDFDLQGTAADVLVALSAHPVFGRKKHAKPGRPKLGVLSREVSLLPRHWEWLERQPGGLSVTLRHLVEAASTDKARQKTAREREGIEATSKVMWAVAGNLTGFEEASRALFAKDGEALAKHMARWPRDVRGHLLELFSTAIAPT